MIVCFVGFLKAPQTSLKSISLSYFLTKLSIAELILNFILLFSFFFEM